MPFKIAMPEGSMHAWYAELRLIHVLAVLTSGTLFFLRGMGVTVFGAAWPHFKPVRYLTYTVDTVLLAAGIMLTVVVQQFPFADAWLTVKLLLLVVYIVLGTFAIKRGRTPRIRIASFVAALAVFVFIVSVARTHNPLGLFTQL